MQHDFGPVVSELNDRSREVFRRLVEAYVETGEPVGSRTLSRRLLMSLSPASIRTVMAELERAGLLYAPHVSAGRLPTRAGMRLFVDGLLEVGALAEDERARIDGECRAAGKSIDHVLAQAVGALSGLARCAGMVMAPKTHRSLRQIDFVPLDRARALVVLVTDDGLVENRVIDLPEGVEVQALVEAANFINTRLTGRTLDEVREELGQELDDQRHQLDELARRVIEAGIAVWAGDGQGRQPPALIVRGTGHLLEDVTAVADLERIRTLFDALETGGRFLELLDVAAKADGVQIFIGSDNDLFGVTGCSMIVAPYRDSRERIIGALGVIGPQRLNFARIIPMVDYTAKVVGRFLG